MAKPEIDEDFLLASIGDKKEGKPTPVKEEKSDTKKREVSKTKEKAASKRKPIDITISGNYVDDFLCKNEINERRSIYVSDFVHTKVKRIVKQIAHDDISVGGYIDNVLKHHFEKYKDEINTLYRKERDDLFD